ncbi:Uma2 family endonuclease [Microcoleus sp. B3-D7]|uniref:Uma2 family endonuclease n=1 Tax=Microcoleus sp. B3-D7 TaxID=2818659 RepID=UPI002FD388D8
MVGIGTKLTLAEFLALPDGDIYCEFVDGEAVPKVSPKFFHSCLQGALCRLIRVWCKGRGRVLPKWAILLKRQDKDWVPVPDLTYIYYAPLPKSWLQNEACPAIPELVIEIISPGKRMQEFEEKAKDYLAAGVPRVWAIDPEAILIKSFLTDGLSQVYTDNTLIVDELLPGWELTTRLIFEEAELID